MAVVFKCGFWGITMERIAGELGMVKSSLYAHFPDKETLVRDVIQTEHTYQSAVLSERLEGITEISGAVYVFMQVIYRYLSLRRAFIPVMVLHFAQGGKLEELYRTVTIHDVGSGLVLISQANKPDLGLTALSYSTATWLGSLSTAVLIHTFRCGFAACPSREMERLVGQLHRQIGKPLRAVSDCVVERDGKERNSKGK
jgi:AcrR family transcriptional regulator